MKNTAIGFLSFLVVSCASKEEIAQVNVSEVDTVFVEDTLESPAPELSFEEEWEKRLLQPCDCDFWGTFEVYGEGDMRPAHINVAGELKEYWVDGAHIFGFAHNEIDREMFFVDTLSDKTVFDRKDSVYAGSKYSLGYAQTWLDQGMVYQYPSASSKELFQLKASSFWTVYGCYKSWFKVREWNASNSSYDYGWIDGKNIQTHDRVYATY